MLSGIRACPPDRAARASVGLRLDATLGLDPTIDLILDVNRFEAAAEAGLAGSNPASLHQALALYVGPFLPSLPYEEWTLERRAAIARLYRQVLLALIAEGETGVEERLRMLLAEDSTDEEVGPAPLMRLLGRLRAWSRGSAR